MAPPRVLAVQPVVVGSITSITNQAAIAGAATLFRAATPVKAGAATAAGVAAVIAAAAKAAVVAAAPPTAERVFEGSLTTHIPIPHLGAAAERQVQ